MAKETPQQREAQKPLPMAPESSHVGVRRAEKGSGWEVWEAVTAAGKLVREAKLFGPSPLLAAREVCRVELAKRLP